MIYYNEFHYINTQYLFLLQYFIYNLHLIQLLLSDY